jgi:hypothetical protein
VPTSALIADPDTKYEVTVALTDRVGNPGTVSGVNDYSSTAPAPANNLAITLNPVTVDNIVTVAEGQADNIILSGKVAGAFTAGDVVTIRVHDQVLSTTVDASGNYSQMVSMAAIKADPDTKAEVSVAAKDPVTGQTNTISTSQDYTIETDGTNGKPDTVGKTVALFIDTVTTDNLISTTEAAVANTPVTGKVTGVFVAGDEVTLTINDKPFKGNVNAQGVFSINVPTADLVADRDTQVDGTITTSAGTANAVQNYGLGQSVAPNPVKPAITEVTDNAGNPNNGTAPVTNGGDTNDTTPTLKGTGKPGDVVTIKDGATVVGTTTVNPDGTWTFTTPEQATGPHNYTASTPTGGTSEPFAIKIDTLAPTVAISATSTTLVTGQTSTITFTLSEASADFTNDDIATTGGTLSPLVQSSTDLKS